MLAITALKGLFGPSAYRVYSDAIGRCPTTFSRNISDKTTVTNRLVLTSCVLLGQAKSVGIEPTTILQQYASMYVPQMARKSWLQATFEDLLGPEAMHHLSLSQSMSIEAVARAIQLPGARYEQHFRLIALTMLVLRDRGQLPSLMQHTRNPAPSSVAA